MILFLVLLGSVIGLLAYWVGETLILWLRMGVLDNLRYGYLVCILAGVIWFFCWSLIQCKQ